MSSDLLDELVGRVREAVHGSAGDEAQVLSLVRHALRSALDQGFRPPPECMHPLSDRYAMYPLYVAADSSFSIASAVWGVGQRTPIHDHGVWGVVGVLSGTEYEERYVLTGAGRPARQADRRLCAGDVITCCSTDDDLHAVSCLGNESVVAVHIYGGDIGTIVRTAYDENMEPRPFTSAWCEPRADAGR